MFSMMRLFFSTLGALVVTISVCLAPAWAQLGDVDFDGDVDNADLAIIAGNDGLVTFDPADGDVDSDGDVDEDDFVIASFEFSPSGYGGFYGVVTPDANPARLVYNPLTGKVLLDQTNAPGGVISTFILNTGYSFAGPPATILPFAGTLFVDEFTVISQSDPDSYAPAPGFSTTPHNLGAILPPGLDLAGLTLEISLAVYAGLPGTGVREFELVVLPEPGSLVFLVTAALAVPRRWNRRLP